MSDGRRGGAREFASQRGWLRDLLSTSTCACVAPRVGPGAAARSKASRRSICMVVPRADGRFEERRPSRTHLAGSWGHPSLRAVPESEARTRRGPGGMVGVQVRAFPCGCLRVHRKISTEQLVTLWTGRRLVVEYRTRHQSVDLRALPEALQNRIPSSLSLVPTPDRGGPCRPVGCAAA